MSMIGPVQSRCHEGSPVFPELRYFCSAMRDAMHKRGLCRHAVSVSLSVRKLCQNE